MRDGRTSLKFLAVAAVCGLGLAVGCGNAGGGTSASPATVRTGSDVAGAVVPFAGALWTVAGSGSGSEEQRLVRSADGTTWRDVELPGAPARMTFAAAAPQVLGGTLAVTGRGLEVTTNEAGSQEAPTGQFDVWTTSDGVRWDAGPHLDLAAPFETPPVRRAGGSLVVGATGTDGTFHLFRRGADGRWTEAQAQVTVPPGTAASVGPVWAEDGATVGQLDFTNLVGVAGNRDLSSGPRPPEHLRSTDGGRTWTTSPCGTEPVYTCGGTGITARGLLVRGNRSSTDEGRTWQPVAVTPAPGDRCPELVFRSVTAVDGGWVADASFDYAGGPSDQVLLRSTDGASWTYSTPGRCPSPDDTNSTYSPLARYDGRWWTAKSTADGEAGPVRSTLLSSTDGRRWTRYTGLDLSGQAVGGPVVLDGRLLVLVSG